MGTKVGSLRRALHRPSAQAIARPRAAG